MFRHNISNSALKKFSTEDMSIRTASTVSLFKANLDLEGKRYQKFKWFRRVVWIHLDDVDKLSKGAVKFYSATINFNVFLEVDSPKC